jgi:hypothetical protein
MQQLKPCVLCAQTRSPVAFDISKCFKVNVSSAEGMVYYGGPKGGGNGMVFYFKNMGTSRISFNASLDVDKKKKVDKSKRSTAIVAPSVMGGGAALLVGLYFARRYHQVLCRTRLLHFSACVPACVSALLPICVCPFACAACTFPSNHEMC